MVVSEYENGKYFVELSMDEQAELDRRSEGTNLPCAEILGQRLLIGLFPELNTRQKGYNKYGL